MHLAGPHPLLPRAFRRSRRGIGDAASDYVSAQFQAETGQPVPSSVSTAITTAGAIGGSAVGNFILPGVGGFLGGAAGGAIANAVTKLFGKNDPSPGDWTDWCAENAPGGGIPSGQEQNFTDWSWGPCVPDPNVSQGVVSNASASVELVNPPPPKIVSAGAAYPHSAQTYGSAGWVAAMTALSKLPGPNGQKGQAALAAYNQARLQSAANAISGGTSVSQVAVTMAVRSPVTVIANVKPSHPLMAMAKPSVGLSASASTGETLGIAVLAIGALGFVAWRKKWI